MNFFIELLDAPYAEILKVGTIPVHVEGRKSGLYDMWVFNTCDTHIPFQTFGLRRLG